MSTPKSQRGESSMEFIQTARELRVHTIKTMRSQVPKAYTFLISQDAVRLAGDVHNYAKMANSVYPTNAHEVQVRRDYLIKARCALQALCSTVEVTKDIVGITDGALAEFGRLIDREQSLLTGVMDKDKKRYRKYDQVAGCKTLTELRQLQQLHVCDGFRQLQQQQCQQCVCGGVRIPTNTPDRVDDVESSAT